MTWIVSYSHFKQGCQIDQLVYEFYDRIPEEIKIVEGRDRIG